MATFLAKFKPWLKAILIAASLMPSALMAEEAVGQPPLDAGQTLSRTASSAAPGRPLFRGLGGTALDALAAPFRLRDRDLALFGMAVLGIGLVASNDMWIRERIIEKQDWEEALLPRYTDLGEAGYDALGAGALLGLAYALDQDRLYRSSMAALEALAVAGVINSGIKLAVGSPRPWSEDQPRRRFGDYAAAGLSPSFPSGHSMASFAMAEAYGAAYGRWWTYPLAAMVAYSRVYLSAHWPSDVLAGALVGAGVAHLAVKNTEQEGPLRFYPLVNVENQATMLALQYKY